MSIKHRLLESVCTQFRRVHWWTAYRRLSEGDIAIDGWNGKLSIPLADRAVAQEAFIHHSYDRNRICEALGLLQQLGLVRAQRDWILCVGAQYGLNCLPWIRHGVFRRCVAVETDPARHSRLVENIDLNGYRDTIAAFRVSASRMEPGHHSSPTEARGVTGGMVSELPSLPEVLVDLGLVNAGHLGLAWIADSGREAHWLGQLSCLREQGVPVVVELSSEQSLLGGGSRQEYYRAIEDFYPSFCFLGESPLRFYRTSRLRNCREEGPSLGSRPAIMLISGHWATLSTAARVRTPDNMMQS